MVNWAAVAADVNKVASDLANSKYYEVGEDVADVIVLSVGPVS